MSSALEPIGWLNYSVDSFPGLDLIRVLTGLACLVIAAMALKIVVGARRDPADIIKGRERESAKARACALTVIGIAQFQQIGMDLLVWRLPLVLLTLFYCFRISWRRF